MLYKFSIIIPVYNSYMYLRECIESILQQEEVDFEKEVEIILINDGSIDDSYLIIKEYATKYSKNIKCFNQENKGVSSARNLGLEHANGLYINFLDSDDLLSKDTLIKVKKFYKKYNNEINVVSVPIYFFEAKNEPHILNYKFNYDDIIDINKNFDFIQMSISGTFIKSNALEGKKFNEKLKYGEDAKLINEIISNDQKYGVVKDAKYFYRYRESMKSTMQQSWRNKEWFLGSINKFTLDILENSQLKTGSMSKYLQYVILYDLSWRISIGRKAKVTLSKNEWVEYIKKIKYALKKIDNFVIYKYNRINKKCMFLLYLIKYNDNSKIENLIIKLVWGA